MKSQDIGLLFLYSLDQVGHTGEASVAAFPIECSLYKALCSIYVIIFATQPERWP